MVGGDGALYGTTREAVGPNRGTVFRIDPAGTLTTIYTFRGTGENIADGIDGALLREQFQKAVAPNQAR